MYVSGMGAGGVVGVMVEGVAAEVTGVEALEGYPGRSWTACPRFGTRFTQIHTEIPRFPDPDSPQIDSDGPDPVGPRWPRTRRFKGLGGIFESVRLGQLSRPRGSKAKVWSD